MCRPEYLAAEAEGVNRPADLEFDPWRANLI